MMLKWFATLLPAALLSLTAQAGVIFQDDFNAEAGAEGASALNYTSFSNWTVSEGTVDVVASGNYSIGCAGGDGKCVDLDGSTGNAGILRSIALTLDPGTYTLSFDISGNQRGHADDSMVVTLGGFLDETFTLSASDPWQTIIRSITVTAETTDYLVFNHDGGDNIGILLDNVSLVPEPGTLALIGLGLISLGGARFRIQK